ncbi:MAG: glycosyltransferase family 2 protein [Candidatus Margulisiibacteriota bacterium]
MNDLPQVTAIVLCRNEAKFITTCLDSIIANDYPKDKLEILVVDGMSTDGTREIIKEYENKFTFVKLVDNPRKITPCAFNRGIKAAKGEIVIILGGHSTYHKDYIFKSVKYLNEYKADNVGGRVEMLPRSNTLLGKAITIAFSHPFCAGNSTFRRNYKEMKWVDTVFGGCYRKTLFDKIGYFNEKLINSQDMEFNIRLKKAGGKILLHPEIVSCYYVRSDFINYCKHNFRNGFWAIYPTKFVPIPLSWRHYVPLTFVLSLVVLGILGMVNWLAGLLFLIILGLYLATSLAFSLQIAIKEKDISYLFVMPILFAAFHFGYGLGSIYACSVFFLPESKENIVNV